MDKITLKGGGIEYRQPKTEKDLKKKYKKKNTLTKAENDELTLAIAKKLGLA